MGMIEAIPNKLILSEEFVGFIHNTFNPLIKNEESSRELISDPLNILFYSLCIIFNIKP